MKLSLKFKGGPGSGFHGHKGRPGEVGGSSSLDDIVPGTGLTRRQIEAQHHSTNIFSDDYTLQ